MAIPADTVSNRFVLRDCISHDILDAGMAGQAVVLAGQIQHRLMFAAMNAVAHPAVDRPDRPMDVLPLHHLFMTDQAELAAGLQHEFRQSTLMWTVATAASLFKGRMRIGHLCRWIFVALKTEARLCFNQCHRAITRMWLFCGFVTDQAVALCNRRMHMLCSTEDGMALSGNATFDRSGTGPQNKAIVRGAGGKNRQSQNTANRKAQTGQTVAHLLPIPPDR